MDRVAGVENGGDPSGAPPRTKLRTFMIDIFQIFTLTDRPDAAAFLSSVFVDSVPATWLSHQLPAKVAALSTLPGGGRDAAAVQMADDLVRNDALVVPFAELVIPEFFSSRIGCRVFQPMYFGVDIAALCLITPATER